jgi:hypothetical protein
MEKGKPMERKEAVRLVSRALSIIYLVFGLYETTYLPERLFSYLHYINEWRSAGAPGPSMYLPTLYRVTVGFLLVRIAFYLALAVVFWTCAPWVERTLLPERES